ncbi:hypothetical protein [Mucilaginibacter arboris]|uniref:Uncharacterized protein n=1 Tax=Mucilaginibacter arboris TaxID=2682090 RepID=A0A7K1T125_9SPHI|nr:hypothetical protein [Mucilaginibacter arboris]MVN23238.1 hypothetical protein [Mucilaginibacter arboris]
MADKDLLAIIADILRKMDQHDGILDLHTKLLEKQGEAIIRIGDTLNTFMDVSVKHFEQQQNFNERFLALGERNAKRLDSIETTLNKVLDMETRVKRLEDAVFK